MRLLVIADEAPRTDGAELVLQNRPDAVVTLGDLPLDWLEGLTGLELPMLGVHGNHDGPGDLARAGIDDLHLRRREVAGWSFSGFEGCVRYREGPHQYTQEEATALAERLPAADVLLCHAPPAGLNDDPADRAQGGFTGLRSWVERHEPRFLLHGHTTPDPRTRTGALGPTRVVWVRGAQVVELPPDPRP